MHKIAVYGSLKKGFYNHDGFNLGEPLTTGVVRGAMYLAGSYPWLLEPCNTEESLCRDHVVEIYEIEDYKYDSITRMEVGAGYYPKTITIACQDGQEHEADIYFTHPTTGNRNRYIEEYSVATLRANY